MKNESLLINGMLSIIFGAIMWSLIGPGIMPLILFIAGIGAIAYQILKPKEQEWRLLCLNLGLYAEDFEKKKIYPKILKAEETESGVKLWTSLPYGLSTLDFEKVKHKLEQYFNANIDIKYHNRKAIIEIYGKKLHEINLYL